MNKLDKPTLKLLEKKFLNIQKNIEKNLLNLNAKDSTSIKENWKRKEGGGGKSISISGDVIEKAAANFSTISGNNLPTSSSGLNNKSTIKKSKFHAIGVSVISHPSNPFSPTSHMNVRIFMELGKNNFIKNWWVGGGYDLTPFFESKKDAFFWHQAAKNTLDSYDKKYYKKFAQTCDEYFFLPHRKEQRGIGGIFFDQFQHKDIESSINLLNDVAESYIEAYKKIVERSKNKRFSKLDKDFQLYRRGRYVEFNLLFDRGTKFGIESNGRTESILASLPPKVEWPHPKSKHIIKREKKLLQFINKKWNERT